jgi:steroid delta-isomerase-like uncharacterized protein
MRQRDFITSKMSQESAKLTKGGHHMKRTITVTVMCVAMMLMGAHVRADDPQSRCAQIGQKWVDFWNGLDVTKAFDVFTEDIVYEDVPSGLHASGADEFKTFAQGFFDAFPNSSFALGQSACDRRGKQGFFEWTWTAVDSPGFCGTGRSINLRGVAVIAIQDKRISRDSDFSDFATVLRQLLPEGQECVAGLVGLSK